MNLKNYNKAKVELSEAIDGWWEKTSVDLPIVGDNVIELMASAALQVVAAVDDTQDYLRQEERLKEK